MATTGPKESKNIVCLATSRKPGGRCVAGKEALADGYGSWIRTVSSRLSAEIELTERQYEDGTEPKLLDIIRIPMIGAMPRVHQTENRMIDAAYYWKKTGTVAWDDLDELLDAPTTLG
jgi:hypothetical protein